MPQVTPLVFLLLAAVVASRAAALDPLQVSEQVYAFIGEPGEPSVDNDGNVGNSGFIVGDDGVVVVDTGISYRHGRAMLEAIARVSDKPVQVVINTHAAQEFLFGNAAFAERGVALLAHARSVDLMHSRCEHCLENLRKLLGPQIMQGSRLVLASRSLPGTTKLEVAGKRVRAIAPTTERAPTSSL